MRSAAFTCGEPWLQPRTYIAAPDGDGVVGAPVPGNHLRRDRRPPQEICGAAAILLRGLRLFRSLGQTDGKEAPWKRRLLTTGKPGVRRP